MRIVSRADWGARAPRSVQSASWAVRDAFVTHYSGASAAQTVRAIQDYHMDHNGWSDIGYSFLVNQAGTIYEGRGWDRITAAVQNHNSHTLSVCFIGKSGDDTPAARDALRWLYDEACRRAGRTLAKRGHRDYNSTDCPGDSLYTWVRAGMPYPGTVPAPAPAPGPNWTEALMDVLPTLAQGARGAFVRRAQALVNCTGAGLTEDGDFGPRTAAAVRAVQQRWGLAADAIVGRNTWTALLTR